MIKVRIYLPCRTAMQQGRAKTHDWMVEHVAASARSRDPLMGWTSSADTRSQLRLGFSSREEAIAYATRNGFEYEVIEPQARRPRIKSYAKNFR
ncbi:MAG: hypothetical protein ACI82H_002300 [Alphaproteobacteria bacterium]|jgi:hypothetical protein